MESVLILVMLCKYSFQDLNSENIDHIRESFE